MGARLVLAVRPEVLRPVVLALLVGAAVLVLLRPRVAGGRAASAAVAPAAALAFAVGVYDGFFGPGTGTLLIVSLAGLLSLPLHPRLTDGDVERVAGAVRRFSNSRG